MAPTEALALTGVAIASFTDWQWRKVPNWLTVSMAIVGLGFGLLEGGFAGLLASVGGATTAFAFFVFPFAMKWLGGGDVKLLMSLGCLLGIRALFWISLYTAVAGGLVALGLVIYRQAQAGEFWRQLRVNCLALGLWALHLGSRSADLELVALSSTKTALREKLPYAFAIAIGTALAIARGYA